MNFATQYPEYVTHLVVADIGPKAYPPHHQAILKALNHLEQSRPDSRKQADALLSEYIPEPGIRPQEEQSFVEVFTTMTEIRGKE